MDNQTKEKIIQKVSTHDFYFETPLYDNVEIENLEENILEGDVDAYSSKNGIDTTYEIHSRQVNGSYESSFNNFYKVTLTCKRKGNDILRFFIHMDNSIVVKLGQFPSLVDIQFAEIGKKYDKFLSKETLKEFKRAIGLVTHGVGIGSFVYLRRIFENLIYETFNFLLRSNSSTLASFGYMSSPTRSGIQSGFPFSRE